MPLTTNLARRFYFIENWKRDAKMTEGKKLAKKLEAKAVELGYKNWALFHLDMIRLSDHEFEKKIDEFRAADKLPSHIAERERARARVKARAETQYSLEGMGTPHKGYIQKPYEGSDLDAL